MGYVRTAGMSTAARRARRRAAMVIVGLLAALGLALLIAVSTMQGWFGMGGGDADEQATTVEAPTPTLVTEDVVVNVFNSTGRTGLAGRASDGLTARGFTVDGVDNSDADIEGPGQILHGPSGAEGAQLLADALPQEVELVQDEREDATLDLILGEAWEDLPAPEESGQDGEDG
ncbi:LytR C-terminal domain-containing protein [Serinicoccus kebangsaanensis]|uniref:LytR C-terminal domain-containing protein n=1 Tax=Serinicoccus kebangsaanensis TaxID=2602069 RepID=UPI00124DCADA|nr:LytR C-terminal domain-containing protein [Serinicoccus kebangsaanensis]